MTCLAAKSNKDLEAVDEVIFVPPREDALYYKDPTEYINRLDEIESPNQRLVTLAKSIINFGEEPTHEASLIRYVLQTESYLLSIRPRQRPTMSPVRWLTGSCRYCYSYDHTYRYQTSIVVSQT